MSIYEASEVQADVLPLALKREELAIRDYTKIMAMANIEPTKSCFLPCQESVEEQVKQKVLTPIGKLLF